MLHERPYRFEALSQAIAFGCSGKDYYKLISYTWIDSENIFEHLDEWIDIWSSKPLNRRAIMGGENFKLLKSFPEIVNIFRGAGHENVADGLSWTINKDKAIWFAKRWSNKTPYLASGTIEKNKILAYFTGRGEQEVVVLPNNVKNLSVTRI